MISDCSQFAPGMPAITYGLRGIAYFELRLRGPKQDLHSGTFGGGVTNPANALAELLAALKDKHGRIQVPGFYDDVVPLTDREREEFRALPLTDEEFKKSAWRERPRRRGGIHVARAPLGPADVRHQRPHKRLPGRGREDGAARPGKREVQLPPGAESRSEKDCRIAAQVSEERLPPGIEMELIDHHGARASSCRSTARTSAAAAAAIERGFGRAPVLHPRRRLDSDRHELSPRAWQPTRCFSAGAKTTTTRTAPTKNSASTITTAAHWQVHSFGKSLQK